MGEEKPKESKEIILSKLATIKALADAIVCIGVMGPAASPLPGTVASLGLLLVSMTDEVLEIIP